LQVPQVQVNVDEHHLLDKSPQGWPQSIVPAGDDNALPAVFELHEPWQD
jgi:hypothetical protein